MAENSEIKWYVVHTYSGYENKVKVNLEKAVENNGMQDVITEVTIPTEEVVEIKNNKRKVVQRKLLPGYVLVKMLMTNETWYVVRNTRGVTGFVGAEDMVAKIQGGWFDFDVCVATPDMMGMVGRLGRVLGPKGLMPNPKSGTVSMDVTRAINDIKAGKVEYRVDKTAIIHCPVGKASFDEVKLQENLRTLMEAIIKAKPAAAKGTYIRSAVLSTTMGPGIKLNALKF